LQQNIHDICFIGCVAPCPCFFQGWRCDCMASVLTITEAKGSAKFLIKKKYCESMALVPLQPKHKSVFIASGDNRGQKAPLLASPQYASVLKPRQNDENNRGQKPLLHWWYERRNWSVQIKKLTKRINPMVSVLQSND